MVNRIRRALAGFLLLPGRKPEPAPEVPHRAEGIVCRASAIRGYSNKDKPARFVLLLGHEEGEVLRRLRSVVVEDEKPPHIGRYEDGLNLVVFRGVFGSGGYSLGVRSVSLHGRTISVECDFEDPGDGLRTTVGFTQPAAIIPLQRLPEGKYEARLRVRTLRRSAGGVSEESPSREFARLSFRVKA